MGLAGQRQNLPFHQPLARRASTQESHATGWDLWICRCMIHHGFILSASPELHLHRQQHLHSLRLSASRSKRMTLSNPSRKRQHQHLRDGKAIIWTQLAPCRPEECLTIRYGAKVFAEALQSGRQRTGPQTATAASTEEEFKGWKREGRDGISNPKPRRDENTGWRFSTLFTMMKQCGNALNGSHIQDDGLISWHDSKLGSVRRCRSVNVRGLEQKGDLAGCPWVHTTVCRSKIDIYWVGTSTTVVVFSCTEGIRRYLRSPCHDTDTQRPANHPTELV
jgi:hypothetical protein